MKNKKFLYIICFISTFVFSQKEQDILLLESEDFVKQGNDLFEEKKYADAEVLYKKALVKNPVNKKAVYNLGDAIMGQGRSKEAINQFKSFNKLTDNKLEKAASFHNIGNAHMIENEFEKAVEAFKNSLRNNPKDEETRYNLALAQKMLKENPPQDQNKDKDNKDNKDNKEDNKKDDKDKKDKEDNKDENKKDKEDKKDDKKEDEDKDKDKKDGEDGEDEKDNEDKKDDKKDNKKEKGEPKPQKGQLSPQQMKQLLDAMNNEENKTQKKINAKKVKGQKSNQEKDW